MIVIPILGSIIVRPSVRHGIIIFLEIMISQTQQFAFRVKPPVAKDSNVPGPGMVIWCESCFRFELVICCGNRSVDVFFRP
jgi:hypothetical protein